MRVVKLPSSLPSRAGKQAENVKAKEDKVADPIDKLDELLVRDDKRDYHEREDDTRLDRQNRQIRRYCYLLLCLHRF